MRLLGRADRIDVDEQTGRFVVLDYKGSIAGHEAGASFDDDRTDNLPHKVQALVYASAFRTQFVGYTCAAALYLSYRARWDKEFAAGSYSEPAYDVSSFAASGSCVSISFDAFLDQIEQGVAKRLAGLTQGDIAQRPADKKACEYCPVEFCARRMR